MSVGIDKCTPSNKLLPNEDCATDGQIEEWLKKHMVLAY